MWQDLSGRGLPDVHQSLASTPSCEFELVFLRQSSSMRSALAVVAVDVTTRESVTLFTAWMLSINSSTWATASLLVARSNVLQRLSSAVFLTSSVRRVLSSVRWVLTISIS